MPVLIAFLLWAAGGYGLFELLNYKGWPLWWLVVYGFGTMIIALLWAIIASRRKKNG